MVLKVKRDSDGNIERYKARLVVRGNLQSSESDYTNLYAPVACIELVRLFLAISLAKGYAVDQLDVKGDLLHADLPDTDNIWILLPVIPEEARADCRSV